MRARHTYILRIHRHPRNSQKSNEFTEILRVYRNPKNSQKSTEFTEIRRVHRNPKNSQKSKEFTEIQRINRKPKKSQKSDEFTDILRVHRSSGSAVEASGRARETLGEPLGGSVRIWEYTKNVKLLQKQIHIKDIGKSSSRKLRWAIYYTLYRMDPQKTY